MKRIYLIAFCIFCNAFCCAQRQPLHFDLSKIGLVVNGKQLCEDKGRIQDYPSKVMDQIIATGPNAIPVLTDMIADGRAVKMNEPIICYWDEMTISDLAFCTLSDLFTNPSGTETIPGTGWNKMLGPANDLPAWEQLHGYIREHGRKSLQIKWQQIWHKYEDQIVWNSKERCFELRTNS